MLGGKVGTTSREATTRKVWAKRTKLWQSIVSIVTHVLQGLCGTLAWGTRALYTLRNAALPFGSSLFELPKNNSSKRKQEYRPIRIGSCLLTGFLSLVCFGCVSNCLHAELRTCTPQRVDQRAMTCSARGGCTMQLLASHS